MYPNPLKVGLEFMIWISEWRICKPELGNEVRAFFGCYLRWLSSLGKIANKIIAVKMCYNQIFLKTGGLHEQVSEYSSPVHHEMISNSKLLRFLVNLDVHGEGEVFAFGKWYKFAFEIAQKVKI